MKNTSPKLNSAKRHRGAFTLIELIIVMMIAAILASLSVAAYFKLIGNAKVTSTENLIAQLDAALRERMEIFFEETRSISPSKDALDLVRFPVFGPQESRKRRAVVFERLWATRECFPQQFTDFLRRPAAGGITPAYNPATDDHASNDTDLDKGRGLGRREISQPGRVAILMEYLRRTKRADGTLQLVNNQFDPTTWYESRPQNHNADTESSACLYLILSMKVSGATFSIENVPSQFIKDTDGDGLMEFVDAWGKPLRFYRWPTDYVAYLMDVAKQLTPVGLADPLSSNMDRDATMMEQNPTDLNGFFDYFSLNGLSPRQKLFEEDGLYRLHPAYDPSLPFTKTVDQSGAGQIDIGTSAAPGTGALTALRGDSGAKGTPKAYPLLPMIVSAGPDGEFGLYDTPGRAPNSPGRAPYKREMHLRGGRIDPEQAGAVGDNICNLVIVSGRRQ